MRISLRLIAALGAVVLATGSLCAQPAVAPAPHPALDELVKEYQRFGLPLPPPGAQLVRDTDCRLAFRYSVGLGTQKRFILVGTDQFAESREFKIPILKPDVELLNDVTKCRDFYWLALAVQCRLRGWNELAQGAYAKGRDAISREIVNEKSVPTVGGTWERVRTRLDRSVMRELREVAHEYWEPKIMSPNSDRKELLRYFKEFAPSDVITRELELTVAPRTSKPGSIESLIDDLMEYSSPEFLWNSEIDKRVRGEAAYWKLAEKGFDAIPALLEHVEDPRFTRTSKTINFGHLSTHTFPVRIGHLSSWMLDDFADGAVDERLRLSEMSDPKKAREWWTKAKLIGEERWLTDHALPTEDPIADTPQEPNRVIFRALGAKYPANLEEIYLTVLRKRPAIESAILAKEIASSRLTQARKVKLLSEGGAHTKLEHRLAALNALADVDAAAFRKNLQATLKWFPDDIEPFGSYFMCTESEIVGIVRKTDDRQCWETLTATARRVSLNLRLEFIDQMYWAGPPEQDQLTHHQRLRFLLHFLDDHSSRGTTPPPDRRFNFFYALDSQSFEVRDFAANRLALILGWPVDYKIDETGALSRMMFRESVRQAAKRELDRSAH